MAGNEMLGRGLYYATSIVNPRSASGKIKAGLVASEAVVKASGKVVKAVDKVVDARKATKGISKSEKYSPINPGPLPEGIANTFRSGTYTRSITQSETTLYRVYGGKAGEIGSYWTKTKPNGPLQSVIDSALDQNWGNNATKVVQMKVPKGVEIFEGIAAPQRGLVGGGSQVWIREVNPSWIIK